MSSHPKTLYAHLSGQTMEAHGSHAPQRPVFRNGETLCPRCFGPGVVLAASDREVDLVCRVCQHLWTAEREHPLTPYNPPE